MSLQVIPPYPVIASTDGAPLNGLAYIGPADANPETTPVAVYFDQALTIPAAQPLMVSNGYIVRTGSPARIYVAAGDYSMTVRNNVGALVFYAASSVGTEPLTANNNLSDLTDTGAAIANLGINATAAEINRLSGVTSDVQGQLDGKASNAVQAAILWGGGTSTVETIVSPFKIAAAIYNNPRRKARIAFSNAANENTIRFTDLNPDDTIYIDLSNVKCSVATNEFLRARWSVDNGVTFISAPFQMSTLRNWSTGVLYGRITRPVYKNAVSGNTVGLEFSTNGDGFNSDVFQGIYPSLSITRDANCVEFSFSTGDILAGSFFFVTSEVNA